MSFQSTFAPLSRRKALSVAAVAGVGLSLTTTGLLAGCKKADAKVTLTIGDQKGGMQSLLRLSGALNDLPYKIIWAQFAAAAPLFEALNAGAIDAGIGGDAPFVFFLASRPAAQAVAALNYTADAANSAAILVRPGSGFQNIHDLVGKRIATVRGSTGQYIVLEALKKAGLPLAAVEFVFLEPSDSLSTLISGGVDAWGTWQPYVAVGELHYGLKPIALPANLLAGLGFVVATTAAINDKAAALRDYLVRFSHARAWGVANQAAYAAGFAKDTGLPLDVAAAYVSDATYDVMPIDGDRIATVQTLADLYAEAKLLPATLPVDFAFDTSLFAAAG